MFRLSDRLVNLSATLALVPCALYPQDTTVIAVTKAPVWGPNVTIIEELRIGILDGPDE